MKLLKFGADYCHGCKTLSRQLKENPIPNVEVEEIDIEERDDMVEAWGIKSLPTCILIDENNEPILRFAGFNASYGYMVSEIKKYESSRK